MQFSNKHHCVAMAHVGNFVDNLLNDNTNKLSEFSVTEMCKLDEFQIFQLLSLLQFLGQLPKLSPLQEHNCELENYKQ